MKTIFRLSGRVACKGAGVVTGIARIIKNQSDLEKIQEGDIMVTLQTDINFVPVLELCSALITEKGGRFCHASIYSRENRLCCLTGVCDATTVINDGQMIRIDTLKNIIQPI